MSKINEFKVQLDKLNDNQVKTSLDVARILEILESKKDHETRLRSLEDFKSFFVGSAKLIGILGVLAGIVTGVSDYRTSADDEIKVKVEKTAKQPSNP